MIEFFNIANDCIIGVLNPTIVLFVEKPRKSVPRLISSLGNSEMLNLSKNKVSGLILEKQPPPHGEECCPISENIISFDQ